MAKNHMVSEVLARVEGRQKKTKKRTLVLTEKTYEQFEKICRKKGLFPSEVVDGFIEVFVEIEG